MQDNGRGASYWVSQALDDTGLLDFVSVKNGSEHCEQVVSASVRSVLSKCSWRKPLVVDQRVGAAAVHQGYCLLKILPVERDLGGRMAPVYGLFPLGSGIDTRKLIDERSASVASAAKCYLSYLGRTADDGLQGRITKLSTDTQMLVRRRRLVVLGAALCTAALIGCVLIRST